MNNINTQKRMKAAHFLLIPELMCSPPNKAIITAYLELGYSVDVFSPGIPNKTNYYGQNVRVFRVEYTWLWIFRNMFNPRWISYKCFSGTSEDPLAVVGLLSFLYMAKSFCLVDEIKSGSYRGDRSERWKRLCRFSMRNSVFNIVNDRNRIELLREYAGLNKRSKIIVYPGCFHEKPEDNLNSVSKIRDYWGFPDSAFVIGSSGGFNMTAGADWLLNSVRDCRDLHAVIQPLGVSELSMFLLDSLSIRDRVFIEKKRLGWEDAWLSARGLDVGMCIYTNQAPQFQNMGISSNRLCMFIAMGVPVIASSQESFKFLEQFDCGVIVQDYTEFLDAIDYIKSKHRIMVDNCKHCYEEYIKPLDCYANLKESIRAF
jgi:glycosyltransferase involved in cell wall biosynthesis